MKQSKKSSIKKVMKQTKMDLPKKSILPKANAIKQNGHKQLKKDTLNADPLKVQTSMTAEQVTNQLFKEFSRLSAKIQPKSSAKSPINLESKMSNPSNSIILPIAQFFKENTMNSSKKISKIPFKAKDKIEKKNKKSDFQLRTLKKDPKFIEHSDLKNEKKKCRICFSSKCNQKTGDLIIPCNCRGVFATVHQKCISDWIVSMCSDTCDICRFKFSIKAQNKGLIDFIIEERQYHFIWRTLTIILFSLYLVLIVAAFIQVSEKFVFINNSYIMVYKTSCSILIFTLLCYVGYYFIERCLNFREWRKYKYHITVKPNTNCKISEITTPPPDIMRSTGLREYSIKPLIRSVL